MLAGNCSSTVPWTAATSRQDRVGRHPGERCLTEKLKVARGVSGRDMRSTVGERSVWVPLVHSDGGSTRETTETRRGGNYVSSPKTVFNCNAITRQF